MSESLALHIEDLRLGSETTARAEDRPAYRSLLAQMAVVLAKVNLSAPESELFAEIDTYERLWGNTWLECWSPAHPESYELFKQQVGYPGYPAT